MSSSLRNWFENLTLTRKFHPSWILLAVAVSAILAALVWGVAELLSRAEADGLPPAEVSAPAGQDAVQKGGAPATIEPPVVPRETRQKTIQVRFLAPAPATQWDRLPVKVAPRLSPVERAATLRRIT